MTAHRLVALDANIAQLEHSSPIRLFGATPAFGVA
jgi:hypothetical protein